ncbi:endo-1,4-beta-xylanase-like protein (plasmid) [Legionella adelaidensis]|uniref:Endo-1,4-beta-xylanase-like protein n=1 Tax=Legionella adelaidensis TaxID=45056 RepID=A0A0W0R3L2_9GAMM|nr:DUF3298 and DUF4163 domain-containing protein [Legionella adelaidensis]KTC65652.1 endo-1,4-beta-xylanase-like protein [Legionella adelaidensis]VEH85152.1 endo-1,4-beta-xylanase-like protein [Legionella adelaidensis]
MKRFLLWVCCFCFALTASASVEKVNIKKETKNYEVEIYYPKGFKNKAINNTVKQMVDTRLNNFLKYASLKDNLPPEVTSKNSLYIDYKQKYQKNDAVSLLFDISIYDRGAAHPRNSNISFNFIKGKSINLKDMFLADSNFLEILANESRAQLEKMDLPDSDWLKKGSAPTLDNYRIWYFTEKGLAIVFGNYQVAPYSYGSLTVEVPKIKFEKMIKPEIAQAVWGANE